MERKHYIDVLFEIVSIFTSNMFWLWNVWLKSVACFSTHPYMRAKNEFYALPLRLPKIKKKIKLLRILMMYFEILNAILKNIFNLIKFAILNLFLSLTILEIFAINLNFRPLKWFSDPRSLTVSPIILNPM